MMRSPCLNCGNIDRKLCSETCERLRRYQELIDEHDADGQEHLQGLRCRALLIAICTGRTKRGGMDVEEYCEREYLRLREQGVCRRMARP